MANAGHSSSSAPGEASADDRRADAGDGLVERRLSHLEQAAETRDVAARINIPLVTAIIAAAAGLFGQAFVAWFSAEANRELERQKFDAQQGLEKQRLQQQLLLNATQAKVDQAKENLEFLLNTGLLELDAEKIAKIRTELREGRRLAIQPTAAPTADASGRVRFNDRQKAIDLLARVIYGEARGESDDAKQAVANVVINRARSSRFAGAVENVILQPYQFPSMNKNDPNYPRLLSVDASNSVFQKALEIAEQAIDGTLPDLTAGATHYHSKAIGLPGWARANPDAKKTEIGNFMFYAGIN